jgi:acyl carrier protein
MAVVSVDLGSSICELVAKQFDAPLADVDEESRLIEDLGGDLVSLTSLALAVEEYFDIEVSDEEWLDLETVRDVIECVAARLSAGSA